MNILPTQMASPNQGQTHAADNAVKRIVQRIKLRLRLLLYHFTIYLTSHPWLLRSFFARLRASRPVLTKGKFTLVTRHEDVRQVLNRMNDFTLAELTQDQMLGGTFLLSIDWTEQHDRERAVLENLVCRNEDANRIRTLAARRCEMLITEAKAGRSAPYQINFAKDFSEKVATHVIADYFGVTGPDEMVLWLRKLASAILVNPPAGSEQRRKVERCAADLRAYLQNQVLPACDARIDFDRDAAPKASDDFLTRVVKYVKLNTCSKNWLNEDWICRYITGLTVTGNATIARASTHALDQLLARRQVLNEAQVVAKTVHRSLHKLQALAANGRATPEMLRSAESNFSNARELLLHYAYEALRFRPMLPLLGRFSPRETLVGVREQDVRKTPAGAVIFAPPIAGMFDPDVFYKPRQFRIDRSLDSYLHFGHGPHVCFGKYVADEQITELLGAVLRLPNLRRANGRRGRVKYDDAAVASLWIEFD